MAQAGKIVARTFEVLKNALQPGITTAELDRLAEEFILSQNALPAFKGYQGFPASICVSINEEVVHGIPSAQTVLKEGDIVSIDCGAIFEGYYGDAAKTFPVGEISLEKKELLKVTEEALKQGIEKAKVGNRLGDIGYAIQEYAEKRGYGVVRDYVGHGIGRQMHEDPQVPNFGVAGKGIRLVEGMVLAIEPMINLGTYRVKTLANNWTVVTLDGKPSAHFEHTVAITPNGPLVLTRI
jgi:methionyl aminopeptidase